jgi:hypothetical protein
MISISLSPSLLHPQISVLSNLSPASRAELFSELIIPQEDKTSKPTAPQLSPSFRCPVQPGPHSLCSPHSSGAPAALAPSPPEVSNLELKTQNSELRTNSPSPFSSVACDGLIPTAPIRPPEPRHAHAGPVFPNLELRTVLFPSPLANSAFTKITKPQSKMLGCPERS